MISTGAVVGDRTTVCGGLGILRDLVPRTRTDCATDGCGDHPGVTLRLCDRPDDDLRRVRRARVADRRLCPARVL